MKYFLLAISVASASCATSTPMRAKFAGVATDETPVNISCEMVAPEMPAAIDSGTVVAKARIVGGRIEDVRIVSGRFEFHDSVIRAMRQYKCEKVEREVVVMQQFEFRLAQGTMVPQK